MYAFIITWTVVISPLQEVEMFGVGNPYRIVVIDCGIKHNMIRSLIKVSLLPKFAFH